MRVLFLALGANRRPAVLADTRTLAEAGGQPVVLADDASAWPAGDFAPGVRLVSLAGLGAGHWPVAAERLILHRAPSFLLRRVGGRRGGQWVATYERRIGRRLQRRAFRPLYGRLWRDAGQRALEGFRSQWGVFDAIVVTDPLSFPVAQRLTAGHPSRIVFRIDQLTSPASSRERS